MNEAYRIEVIDSLKGMAEMERPWSDLLARSRSDTIFLTWDWLYTWAENFIKDDRELFVLAVYRGEELIGIAPWCLFQHRSGILKFRHIEFLGISAAGSDYLDVFAKRGKERDVATSIYRYLFFDAGSAWDKLFLQGLPADSLFLLHMIDKINEKGKYHEIELGAFSPVTVLAKNGVEFMSSLSSNRREQFLRHSRVLRSRGELEHVSAVPGENYDENVLEEFFFLYRKSRPGDHDLFFQFLKMFVFRCVGKRWVQIDFLKVDGKIVATLLHFCYRGRWSMYLSATDRDYYPRISIGNILIGLCLQRAIGENVRSYDFLKGSEPYKFHWAHEGRRSLNFVLWRKGFWVVFLIIKKSLKNVLKLLVR